MFSVQSCCHTIQSHWDTGCAPSWPCKSSSATKRKVNPASVSWERRVFVGPCVWCSVTSWSQRKCGRLRNLMLSTHSTSSPSMRRRTGCVFLDILKSTMISLVLVVQNRAVVRTPTCPVLDFFSVGDLIIIQEETYHGAWWNGWQSSHVCRGWRVLVHNPVTCL